MSTRKKIISILAIVFAGAALCGCGYNELPPKTSDASKSYIKPKGEIPTPVSYTHLTLPTIA